MPMLILKFEEETLKEIPVDRAPVTIGRAPDNAIPIDNLAVSNYHARIESENGRLFIEDLGSLNGTFVNGQRIKRVGLSDGDMVLVGKHHLLVDTFREVPVGVGALHAAAAPKVNETVILDTKQRRDMVQRVAAAGERSQIAPARMRVPTLAVLAGKAEQREYLLSGKLTVIGKSAMATVRLQGWFAPQVAAQINRKDDGYYLGRGARVPKVNGQPVTAPLRLSDGDVIEVCGVRLSFVYRD